MSRRQTGRKTHEHRIVMKKTSENKPDVLVLLKWSSGIMRVQFHNCGKSTHGGGKKTPTKHNDPLTQTRSKLIIYSHFSLSCQARTKGRGFSQGHNGSKVGNKDWSVRNLFCCLGVNAIMYSHSMRRHFCARSRCSVFANRHSSTLSFEAHL